MAKKLWSNNDLRLHKGNFFGKEIELYFLNRLFLIIMTRFLTIIILTLFIAPLANAKNPSPPSLSKEGIEGLEKVRVIEVHDGDTISIRTRSFAGLPLKAERVRLIGIDAPELRQKPWGRMSKRHLKKLISDSAWVLSVEFDVKERDKYERLLGYVWDRRGQLLNEKMLENGYAVLYTIPPNVKYVERLIAAQKNAQMRKVGIWGKKGLKKSPREWRKEHPR